jgi:hypothetical protein
VPYHSQIAPIVDEEAEVENESTSTQVIRKKRPGLTQGLVPGKKVMKLYKKHSSQDTGWRKGNR